MGKIALAASLVIGSLATPSYGDETESVTFDPVKGDYVFIYYNDDTPSVFRRVVWTPATKIEPTVQSSFRESRDSATDRVISYRYHIHNRQKSRQNIASVGVSVSSMEEAVSPRGWMSASAFDMKSHQLSRVGWLEASDDPLAGIGIGKALGDFGITSDDLPGVGEMRLSGGVASGQSFPDEGPDPTTPIAAQIDAVTEHDYVVRHVVVPWIRVPDPFTAAPILSDLQRHVDQDLVSMNLIDASLVSRLDPLFESAIAAAQGGNMEALRGDLGELRRALRHEHEPEDRDGHKDGSREVEDSGERDAPRRDQPIAKLAREVLDFDLQYVERHATPGRAH